MQRKDVANVHHAFKFCVAGHTAGCIIKLNYAYIKRHGSTACIYIYSWSTYKPLYTHITFFFLPTDMQQCPSCMHDCMQHCARLEPYFAYKSSTVQSITTQLQFANEIDQFERLIGLTWVKNVWKSGPPVHAPWSHQSPDTLPVYVHACVLFGV